MKTADEYLQDLKETILSFEKLIQDTKVTSGNLSKVQTYLDDLEKEFPPKDRTTDPKMLFFMYELQALIDLARGNVRRAKAFVLEASDLQTGESFASETAQELTSTTGKTTGSTPKIDFFVVSGWRLLFMGILSGGLYASYWFYKNFKAIETATGRKQHAILSAIFAAFFSYSLFQEVKQAADDSGYNGKFSPGWRAIAYFFFGIIPLFYVQTVMRQTGAQNQKAYSPGEIVVLALGLLYWVLWIVSMANSSSTTTTTNNSALTRSVFMSNCSSEATKNSSALTTSEADSYCGCVYDTGVDRFGKEEFLSKAAAVGDGDDLTPEMNSLVTECITQVQSI